MQVSHGRYKHVPLDVHPGSSSDAGYRASGPEGVAWIEGQRPVPGRPDVPPDHWITSR